MKKKNIFNSLFSYIELKHFMISTLIIFLGALSTIFSPSYSYNFWYRLLDVLTNEINIIILISVIIINMINLSKKLNSSNIIIRYKKYEEYLQKYLKIILLYSFINILINLIFCLVGTLIITILMGNFDFSIKMHEIYKIPLFVYLLFFEIRKIMFILLLVEIMYYIYHIFNEKLTLLVVFLILLTFFINVNYPSIVLDLSNIPIIITRYFSYILYTNIFLEISCSLIQSIFLCSLIYCLKNIFLNRKKELI